MAFPFGGNGGVGAAGPTGYQGNLGPQGVRGTQGVTGAGVQGVAGFQGNVGNIGPNGFQGITGAGVQGVGGPQGVVGAQGVTGTTGNAGVQGVKGVQGLAAAIGYQGVDGSIGATGGTGPTGPIGVQGVTGLTAYAADATATYEIWVAATDTGVTATHSTNGTYAVTFTVPSGVHMQSATIHLPAGYRDTTRSNSVMIRYSDNGYTGVNADEASRKVPVVTTWDGGTYVRSGTSSILGAYDSPGTLCEAITITNLQSTGNIISLVF
jgi:hypothetical protein